MKASMDTIDTATTHAPRFHLDGWRSVRGLLVATVLVVAVAASSIAGVAVWASSDGAPASEASGGGVAGGEAQGGLQPGWTNAVEECDCLFGGQ